MSEKTIACSDCGAPASVHLTQITENQVKKVHYCESCATKHGALSGIVGFIAPIAQALAAAHIASMVAQGAVAPSGISGDTRKCPKCGFTAGDFLKNSLLGCPHCYVTFRENISGLLEKIQPGAKHRGRVLIDTPDPAALREAISTARENMQNAVKREAYEDAAKIRDAIKQLEAELAKANLAKPEPAKTEKPKT